MRNKTSFRLGVRHQIGVKNNAAKLDEVKVLFIRNSRISNTELAAILGVHDATVCRVRSRKAWSHV